MSVCKELQLYEEVRSRRGEPVDERNTKPHHVFVGVTPKQNRNDQRDADDHSEEPDHSMDTSISSVLPDAPNNEEVHKPNNVFEDIVTTGQEQEHNGGYEWVRYIDEAYCRVLRSECVPLIVGVGEAPAACSACLKAGFTAEFGNPSSAGLLLDEYWVRRLLVLQLVLVSVWVLESVVHVTETGIEWVRFD